MTTKLSHSDNPQLNERTMEQIAQRVADFKESKDRSKSSAEEVESHLGALSEVFHVKKCEVESIANDVFIRESQQRNFKDKFYDGLIKYGKQVIAIIIVSIIVSFLLLGRSVVQPQNQSIENMNNNVAPDYSKFAKKATLSNAINTIIPIKMEVTEYHMSEGTFPRSLDDIGVNASDMKEIDGIEGLVLGKKGEIIIKTDKSIGENIVLKLFPKEINGFLLQWKCHTNFPGYFRGCDRVKMDQELKYFK